jgi:dTMP kinase
MLTSGRGNRHNMPTGKFITLEGGEGVGKSTNLIYIKELLESRKVSVTITREPGGTLLGENIRQILLANEQENIADSAELLMMFAARAQHIKHVIQPALENGHWVICDRFTDATYAYQGGGRQMCSSAINWLENFIQDQFRPDLTLLFDAPVNVGIARAKKRAELDRFETQQQKFFERVRNTYLDRANTDPERIKIIHAEKSLLQVQQQVRDILFAFFK